MNFVITEEQLYEIKNKPIYELSIGENKITEASQSDVNLSSFKERKKLNDKIWMDNGKLIPKVRKKLLDISDDFMDFINLDPKHVKDILFVGSIANYNWSRFSDIDLHILVDFKNVNKDTNLVREYFDAKKTVWNDSHDELKIYGFPVEVYVQDVNEQNASIGVYSIESNKWVKEPEHVDPQFDINSTKKKVSELMTEIEILDNKFKTKQSIEELRKISNKIESVYRKIKRLRKNGLESKNGEFSVGNIAFKALRRSGYISLIHDLRKKIYNKINSLN